MQILCATDFSKPSMAAADVAAAIAKKLHLSLRLVHCSQDWVVMGDLPVVVSDDKAARDHLKSEAERHRATGLDVAEDFRNGSASFEIVDAASEQPTKMIVLGSVGKGMADRWLIGSVAERVAESASVPTLVVRQPELLQSWLSGETSLRLLCGVDFTISSDAAIAAIQPLITIGQVEVEATYVCPSEVPFVSKEQELIHQRDVWEQLHARLGELPFKVHVRSVAGLPAAEFLHTADEQIFSLLVVGTHQRHGWQRLKASSFSRNVLTHASTNVLCVPAATGTKDDRIPTIRRVLLATNFTDVCNEALRHAHSLLPSGGAIHILHVCPEPTRGINPIIASDVYFDHSLASAKAKQEAKKHIQDLPRSWMQVPGVAITSEVLSHFNTAAAICDAANRSGADVICMGTKGHSRTGVAILGSTVQGVLALSHKPVFVVTPPLT